MAFSGKRILVTGSSRGIGYATAAHFLSTGARVAINGRTIASTAQGIEQLGGRATNSLLPAVTSRRLRAVCQLWKLLQKVSVVLTFWSIRPELPTFYPWRHLTRRYGT